MAEVMLSKDGVSASLAECYITIEGNRYNFMQMIDFESRFDKEKTTIPILGKTGKGNFSTGWTGTFSGTAHYNQSIMRDLLLRYKDTGEDIYFDIQISNEDPTSSAGRQTIIHKECNIDGGVLAKFDADGDYLTEDINGTFDDFQMPKKFNMLNGME